MEIPTTGARTPSQPTILKTQNKRLVRNPAVKKPRTTPKIHIVDFTDQVGQLVSRSLIIEEIPPNTYTIPP